MTNEEIKIQNNEEESAVDNLRKARGLQTNKESETESANDSERELNIMTQENVFIDIGGVKMKVYPLSIRRFKLFSQKISEISKNEKIKQGFSSGMDVTAGDVSFMESIMELALDELIGLIAIIIPDITKMKDEDVEEALTIPKMIDIIEIVKKMNHWEWLKKNLLQNLLPRAASFIGGISSKISQNQKVGK